MSSSGMRYQWCHQSHREHEADFLAKGLTSVMCSCSDVLCNGRAEDVQFHDL